MKPIVYIASSITNASPEQRAFVAQFRRDLRETTPAIILEWIHENNPIPLEDFFKRDLNNVKNSDVMIALLDEPSIGVDIEIHEGLLHKKPLLCLHREDRKISKLLLSAQESYPFTIETYKDIQDAVKIADDFIMDHVDRSHETGLD